MSPTNRTFSFASGGRFMVGGSILMHGVPALHHLVDSAARPACGHGVTRPDER